MGFALSVIGFALSASPPELLKKGGDMGSPALRTASISQAPSPEGGEELIVQQPHILMAGREQDPYLRVIQGRAQLPASWYHAPQPQPRSPARPLPCDSTHGKGKMLQRKHCNTFPLTAWR